MTTKYSVPMSPEASKVWDTIKSRISDPGFIAMQKEVDRLWNQATSMPWGPERNGIISLAKELGDEVNSYRDDTAVHASHLSALRPLDQWDKDHVGKCVMHSDNVNSGSVAGWLASRKNGFGGSDIGNLLGLGHGKFGKTPSQVVEEKATLDLDPVDVAHNIVSKDLSKPIEGPLMRGNAWEAVIAHMFQDLVEPEDMEFAGFSGVPKVFEAKATFCSSQHEWQTVNVDGLLCSDGATPDGILEIKTGSSTKFFRREEMTDEGWQMVPSLPGSYKAQLLSYLYATGFDYGVLVALIGDNVFEQYSVLSTDTLDTPQGELTFPQCAVILDDLWSQVIALREKRYGPQWKDHMEGMEDRVMDEIDRMGGVNHIVSTTSRK